MIEAHALYKHFGDVRAVDGLSFQAPDGAITGLLGSNGAGKTTTLRMIANVLKPDRGSIRVTGSRGALLDHTGIYPRLTSRENLEYFGQLHGMRAGQLRERADELLSVLGMERLVDRRTAGFSQGERMKVALARAVMHSPRNLLLDEPTNGLDIPTIRSLRTFLQSMRDKGASIVFSSHVLGEVRALCDRVIIVARGVVVAEGSPNELCNEEAFVEVTA